jgi:Flp pilus assembly protein TadD
MLLNRRIICVLVMATATTLGSRCAQGEDRKISISIPKRSKLTPVQRLNREGVEALQKHKYQKAEQLFYRAYLYDPADAFTLNNLGYIAELKGDIDRAERFYQLASDQSSEAVVDLASSRQARGKPMKDALAATSAPLEINHANVEAVRLLSQGRSAEADLLLQHALEKDPHNAFTLNNMGVAKEMEGEEEQALKYYDEASGGQSGAAAVVTANPVWRGRPINQMAQQNAKGLRDYLSREKNLPEQVAELNLRGVSAVNRNDLRTADADFRKAYALDPNNAFTLNNIGYVAELEGDQETAEFFYDHARQSLSANATVGVATRKTAEGRKLFSVAEDSNSHVQDKVAQERQSLQRQGGPVVLRRRDNSIVEESTQPAQPQ